jgi:hypothetical protein
MSKLSFIITDPAVGGTFVSWSVEYLAGHDVTYSVEQNAYIPIVDNPVQEHNAHIYKPNQYDLASDVDNAISCLTNLQDANDRKIDLIYVHPYFWSEDKHNDWFNAVDKITESNRPIVIVKMTTPYLLYHGVDRKRGPADFQRGLYTKHNTSIDINISEFFAYDSIKWEELNLTNQYDKREFLALNLRPFDTKIYNNMFKTHPTNKILSLCAIDVWQMLDITIYDIMDFLNIEINQDRYKKWHNVYNEWKKLHTKRIMWCWYYDQIIEYIINGYDMDLTRFDLDLVQESTIQHTMIFKHGLNFKTFNLDTFTNTKQLHDLLEPNIHPIHQYECN